VCVIMVSSTLCLRQNYTHNVRVSYSLPPSLPPPPFPRPPSRLTSKTLFPRTAFRMALSLIEEDDDHNEEAVSSLCLSCL